MTFIHEDPEFNDLVQIVAQNRGLARGLIEKDYWVTHSLWALSQTKLEIWLKGGTSLSKGFHLIERFSEDLDLRIERGREGKLPTVTNWKSANKGPVTERRAFYETLEGVIAIPDVVVQLNREQMDPEARGANYEVRYPGKFLRDLRPFFRPFVLLEVGKARVTPFLSCPMSSFVQDWLQERGELKNYEDNRPRGIRCVHPWVTLLEKLDAIARRFPRGGDPAPFIRHYADSAKIIQAQKKLPPLEGRLASLIADMTAQKQIQRVPTPENPAFGFRAGSRREDLEKAYRAISPMFWGDRLTLREASEMIRGWLREHS